MPTETLVALAIWLASVATLWLTPRRVNDESA